MGAAPCGTSTRAAGECRRSRALAADQQARPAAALGTWLRGSTAIKKGERKRAPPRSSGEVWCHLASSWPRLEGMNAPRGSREPPHRSRGAQLVSVTVSSRRDPANSRSSPLLTNANKLLAVPPLREEIGVRDVRWSSPCPTRGFRLKASLRAEGTVATLCSPRAPRARTPHQYLAGREI